MHDLTGLYPAALVPSSMSCGNTISDSPALAMTAPGSPSVNPIPDRTDVLPQPTLPAAQIPVNNDEVSPSHVGYPGSWGRAGGSSGRWEQL